MISMQETQNQTKVLIILISIQLLFGINFVTSKYIVEFYSPINWAFLRTFLSGVLFFSYLFFLKKSKAFIPDKKIILPLIYLSLIGMSIPQVSFLAGLKKTSTLNSSMICATIPLFTLTISLLRKTEELTLNKLLGLALGLAGVIILKDFSEFKITNQTLVGDSLILLNCLSIALFLNLGKDFFKKYSHIKSTAIYVSHMGSLYFSLHRYHDSKPSPPSLSFLFWPVCSFPSLAPPYLPITSSTGPSPMPPQEKSLFLSIFSLLWRVFYLGIFWMR